MTITAPLHENSVVESYINAHRAILRIEEMESEITSDPIRIVSNIDYFNFLTLATILSSNLPMYADSDVFLQSVESKILEKSTEKIFNEIMCNMPDNPWYETRASFIAHHVVLHDVVKLEKKDFLKKLEVHSTDGKVIQKFNEIFKEEASGTNMHVTINITAELWKMNVSWDVMSCLFYEAEAFPSLFSKVLTPTMKLFYKLYY